MVVVRGLGKEALASGQWADPLTNCRTRGMSQLPGLPGPEASALRLMYAGSRESMAIMMMRLLDACGGAVATPAAWLAVALVVTLSSLHPTRAARTAKGSNRHPLFRYLPFL